MSMTKKEWLTWKAANVAAYYWRQKIFQTFGACVAQATKNISGIAPDWVHLNQAAVAMECRRRYDKVKRRSSYSGNRTQTA